MVIQPETWPAWKGDESLANEAATWGATHWTFHRVHCARRYEPPTHTGTFRDAAKKLLRPCLVCWHIPKKVQHNVIDRTWIAIVRETHADCNP